MSTLAEFLDSITLGEYSSRFVEQGIEALEDLRYERDLDGLIEDVGLSGANATKFKVALHAALRDGKEKKRESSKDAPATKDDLKAAVAASMAKSRARQGIEGESRGGGAASTSGGGGEVRMSGATEADFAPKVSVDERVSDEINAKLGLATASEINEILAAHKDRDLLRLLKLKGVPIDALGKVDWSGHGVLKTNEIAMRCKLLSLRLDSSRNNHPLAKKAQRAVQNAQDLLSHKDTRREFLTMAVRRAVDEMRAEGKIQGGYVSYTGVHYAAGAMATKAAEENYVSKDMMNAAPTYDESIHFEHTETDDGVDAARVEVTKKTAPKVDVSSIRAKLASKSKKPRFM